jgi:nucleoid DNA-binding protein
MDGKLVDLIISIIQDRLIDHNAAILPDFGVLFIREQGAEFDLTDEQMLPPQQLIEFLHSTDVQDYSVSYNLSERHEFDIDQSISALDDFVTHVYSSLNSEKRFEFGSLGVFNMSDAGEINFEQSDALPMGLNFGFKPISAVPVKRLELEHKETTIIEGPEPTAAKSGSRRAIMWSAAAILLVIVSATLLIQILGGDNPANPKFTSTALDHDRLNADPTQMEQINDVYTFDELRNGKNEEKIVVDDSTSVDLEQSEASGLTDDEQD